MDPSSRTPLAIVGASARAAAASAVRAGFQPVTADLFADLDLRRIASATRISPYPDGLLDWLRVIQPRAWMYTGALENHPKLIDQMAWIAPLWGNPGDVVTDVRNPLHLAASLRDAGLLFPETCTTPEALPRDGSWLVKSYRGASGSGVHVLNLKNGSSSFRSASDAPCFYQQRVSGVPCAATFVALDNTAALIGVTRQLIGAAWLRARGFQFAGSIGPLPVSAAVNGTLMQIGDVLSKSFELSGLFGVDFILDGESVWTVEVNPRYTASVEICERALGWCAIEAHANNWPHMHAKRTSAWSRLPTLVHGKAILFAKRNFVISDEFAEMGLAEAVREPWPTLADISAAGTRIDVGRPVLTIFAWGGDGDEVERKLRDRVADIKARLYAD
jgi:predicted ATP-grasp superfamily ATP-dependent carboligase